MTGLVFKNISILSKPEKAAISINLVPGVNLLTGKNDVGKSTLIKSLYHTLGADVPQMNNSLWKKARPVYCVNVIIHNEEFYIIRDGKFFGVFDKNKKLLSRHQNITTESGIAHFLCPKLGFRIELERSRDKVLQMAGPAYYFLPFYIDQDEGWSSTWSSFRSLQMFTNYRKLMIEYHLGVRPQSYYDTKKKDIEFKDQLASVSRERENLEMVKHSYQERKAVRQVDIDPNIFRKEIEQLVDKYNAIYSRQQIVLNHLKDVRNERNSIDTDLQILSKAMAELNADYEYAESPELPDCIDCPTCGTNINNSFAERFGLLDDIDYCLDLVDQRKKDRMDIQTKLDAIESEYNVVSSELNGVEALLKRRKENVTFAEIVTSEGIKELLSSINEDILQYKMNEDSIQEKIDKLAENLKVDAKKKKKIVAYYQSRMKEFLNNLNVDALVENDYKRLEQVIKNNVLGSDLPRSLLAQYFAFLHTMKEFNELTLCPMVIDSPQQQEQDDPNLDAIFRFIFSKTLLDQQLILATVSVNAVSGEVFPDDINLIELDEKLSLLKKEEYQSVLKKIGYMHDVMLAEDI